MLTSIESLASFLSLSQLRLSPKGQRFAFFKHQFSADLSGYDSTLEVWDLAGPRPLFDLPQGVTSFVWADEDAVYVSHPSPEGGSCLSFCRSDGSSQLVQSFDDKWVLEDCLCQDKLLISVEKQLVEETLEDGCHLVDEYPFWFDGKGITSGIRKQLFAWQPGRDPVRLTPEHMHVKHFHSDGRGRVLAAGPEYRGLIANSDRLVLCDQMEGSCLYLDQGDRYRVKLLALLGDSALVCATDARESYYAPPKFTRFDLKSGEKSLIADPDLSIGNSTISDVRYGNNRTWGVAGKTLYFIATVDHGSQIYSCSDQGDIAPVTSGLGAVDSIALGGETLLFSGLRGMQLQEIYQQTEEGERQVTYLNQGKSFPEPDYLTVRNTQGHQVSGLVYEPRGGSLGPPPYPGILCIHGGPNGTYASVYHHEMQMLADRGYYVFCCNPTGSDGKKEGFGDISGRWGTIDYDDIMHFLDQVLIHYPLIDRRRLIVFGGSYGGFMTNWIIGHSDRFCAAISDRCISNSPSKDVTGDNGGQYGQMHLHTDVYRDPLTMWAKSPLKYASNVKTPTLFIHGVEDFRCHISQAQMMFTALKLQRIPARLVGFKGQTHDLCRTGQPRQRYRRLREITAWIERWTQEGSKEEAARPD